MTAIVEREAKVLCGVEAKHFPCKGWNIVAEGVREYARAAIEAYKQAQGGEEAAAPEEQSWR